MIPERAAAYVLAVVCVFQALHPSRMINAQGWRSIDIRIGRLRVQATNYADSVCFEGLAGKKEEGLCSLERPILILRARPRDLKSLSICMTDSGCMTAWLDETLHGWSVSKDR
jgi:hypothetical protein